jgi:NTP pyrophosphatase (non-canonical NTP hydrolase)
MSMTLGEYQHEVLGMRVYPPHLGVEYTALGLCGEAGEYAEKVKKGIRDGNFDREGASKELGDVLWYLAAAAAEIGCDLDDIAQANLDKLRSRQVRDVVHGEGDER